MMITASTMDGITVQINSNRLSCAKKRALRSLSKRYLLAKMNSTEFTKKNTAMMMYMLKFINVSYDSPWAEAAGGL